MSLVKRNTIWLFIVWLGLFFIRPIDLLVFRTLDTMGLFCLTFFAHILVSVTIYLIKNRNWLSFNQMGVDLSNHVMNKMLIEFSVEFLYLLMFTKYVNFLYTKTVDYNLIRLGIAVFFLGVYFINVIRVWYNNRNKVN